MLWEITLYRDDTGEVWTEEVEAPNEYSAERKASDIVRDMTVWTIYGPRPSIEITEITEIFDDTTYG